MQMSAYEQHRNYPTNPGWYCIGFDREDKEVQASIGPDFGQIYYYTGVEWTDDDGEPVDGFFDPSVQMRVATHAADYYWPQV